MKEIIVVTGLGIGEETKGSTVEWLGKELGAHTILRSGGCQAGHHIVREDGTEQTFSHFGAGTFDGSKTHLKHMVIEPVRLFNEAIELEEKGVKGIFDKITIDGECLVITPYHWAISRIRELMRGNNKKGTVGMGAGEVVKDSNNPLITVRAKDFDGDKDELLNKIERIRQNKIEIANELLKGKDKSEVPERVWSELELMINMDTVRLTLDSFIYLKELVKVTTDDYFDELINREGIVVCEASHGALLHPDFGFVPHVTQIDPTAQDVLESIEKSKYNGKVLRLGVSRCYLTRHGAGPLVSFDEEMTNNIIETHNNSDIEWLGEFRNGAFDLIAMKYAIEASGGRISFDGLVISYMDLLVKNKEWIVCEKYNYKGNENTEDYFFIEGNKIVGIKKYVGKDKIDQINHQTKLTEILKQCEPVFKILKETENETMEEMFVKYIEKELDLPVVALAYGPKMSDRKFRINLSEIG